MARQIAILESWAEVESFLPNVTAAADANRIELGFFPVSVYSEFARRGQLYVALDVERRTYVGHLLFDCRHPRATVLQMYISPARRGTGVASALLQQLVDSLTASGFLGIYARVAEDLTAANAFWAKQHFYVQRTTPGGTV